MVSVTPWLNVNLGCHCTSSRKRRMSGTKSGGSSAGVLRAPSRTRLRRPIWRAIRSIKSLVRANIDGALNLTIQQACKRCADIGDMQEATDLPPVRAPSLLIQKQVPDY
jgi:hypothetical protein